MSGYISTTRPANWRAASPTADEVADWIAQARQLPILVTYQPRDQEAAS